MLKYRVSAFNKIIELWLMLKIFIRKFFAKKFSGLIRFIIIVKLKAINVTKVTPVIILTKGKVGSSSVYYSLKGQLNTPVFHLHKLSVEGIRESKITHLNSTRGSIPLHLIISEELNRIIAVQDDLCC